MIWRYMRVLTLYFILIDGLHDGIEPMVYTKWGKLRGKWSKSLQNRRVANFLGIPYALPPIGDLRFKSPQQWNNKWESIRDATADGNMCLQISDSEILGSEDCLYLNIFIPYIPGIQFMKLPVLVFLHSGAYASGSSDSKLLAPDYLMDQNIILVTLNYRLNIFGFFSTTNQVAPGNYGLKDMKMALEWIHENIHSFNGNPESVTLIGASAGAASAHLLALSNKTERLFHKYILFGGSALTPWAYHSKKNYRQTCLKLARLVGCQPKKDDDIIASNETIAVNCEKENGGRRDANVFYKDYNDYNEGCVKGDEEMVKCMKTIDARQLVKMSKHFNVWRNNPMCSFAPTLEDDSEDAILTMNPWKIIKNGLFRDMPAIIEIVEDEGLVKTLDFFLDPSVEKEMIENFEEYIFYFLENRDWISNTSIFTTALQDFYFNGNVSLGLKGNITEVINDSSIKWPILKTIQYQSAVGNSSIYFSLFAYKGTFSHTFASGTTINYGVCHNDDLNYLFPILNNKYQNMMLNNTDTDFIVINTMTEMLANFMREGIPRAWMIPAWPDYRNTHQFMRFGIGKSPDIVVQTDFLCDRMKFWDELLINVSTGLMECNVISDNYSDNTQLGVLFMKASLLAPIKSNDNNKYDAKLFRLLSKAYLSHGMRA
ncbi:esterase FE4-like [Cataglyphis hispanica]|uniref:esterase FE4-like n=1 Tax=Cataglyphis hispanica TaxID=1086592 RepID=UPI00217FAF47|nr:esterase FE4-like [Cataglyphis hispanica]